MEHNQQTQCVKCIRVSLNTSFPVEHYTMEYRSIGSCNDSKNLTFLANVTCLPLNSVLHCSNYTVTVNASVRISQYVTRLVGNSTIMFTECTGESSYWSTAVYI